MPFLSTVYRSVKQIVETFGKENRAVFKEVVLIEYPRPNCYVLGFLTNDASGETEAVIGKKLTNVFVPTTPNPTSGFLLLLPREDIFRLDMSVGDGMKMLISGGADSTQVSQAKTAKEKKAKCRHRSFFLRIYVQAICRPIPELRQGGLKGSFVRIASFLQTIGINRGFSSSRNRGTLLNRIETGENHLRLMVFSSAQGLQPALLRKIRKKGSPSHPDLFDEVELALQVTKTSGMPFVKEHRVLNKRTELSSSHTLFSAASGIARFYLDNGAHLLEPEKFSFLLDSSLHALMKGGEPLVVRFKMLYVFAKEEGYPVKQSWLVGLSKKELEFAQSVLFQRVSEQSPEMEKLESSLNSLENWLEAETELVCRNS